MGTTGYVGTVSSDLATAGALGLAGTAGHVQVTTSVDGVVDTLGYGATANQAEGTPAAVDTVSTHLTWSMERKAAAGSTAATMEGGADATAGNGFDSDNNSVDFVLRTTRDPQNSASAVEPP